MMCLQDILTYAKVKPAVHQIEVHPMWTNQYNIDFCHKEVRGHDLVIAALWNPCFFQGM